jgi:hypothetical protein
MATIEELITRIEQRLFLAAGIDVQTHAEDQLVEMLRGVYNTLFDDFWYPEYTYYMTLQLDGTTGNHTSDIANQVLRFKDIHSIYYDTQDTPLPLLSVGGAISEINRECVVPSNDPAKVFKILPVDSDLTVTMWYRTRIGDDVWRDDKFDTQIPFDDDVLLYGVVYEFLVMDDSNQTATAEYKNKYQGRQNQMRAAQWQIPIHKRKLNRVGVPNRWR